MRLWITDVSDQGFDISSLEGCRLTTVSYQAWPFFFETKSIIFHDIADW